MPTTRPNHKNLTSKKSKRPKLKGSAKERFVKSRTTKRKKK